MDLAAVLRPTMPAERLVEQAKAAEAAGASELWLWEDCFLTGGIAATAAALAATERIVVGIGILPAPVRNAAFATVELATLARLHSGRLHAGFGHGLAEWIHQVGAKSASQLTLLEEVTLAVRALLRGETVDTAGRYVQTTEATSGRVRRAKTGGTVSGGWSSATPRSQRRVGESRVDSGVGRMPMARPITRRSAVPRGGGVRLLRTCRRSWRGGADRRPRSPTPGRAPRALGRPGLLGTSQP
jgi:alkanesulfonate monooxygenase SsuD/methylene tetrahydromethanopterin reductase-like flavin-dependent oxidoreductase (luciferase family)